MAYTLLLNIIIEQSGLTVKEIAEKCKELGVDITPAYISTLRNDKNNRSPSDKVSKALAKACNYKNENALVVEAYIDNAPPIVQKFFKNLKKNIVPLTMGIMENKLTTQEAKEFESIIDEMPMADFITETAQQDMKYTKGFGTANIKLTSTSNEDNLKITQTITQSFGIPVYDDGMKPLICKGNFIQFEYKDFEDYKNGDIICYTRQDNNNKNVYVRKIVKGKKEITTIPINNDYNSETLSLNDIVIIGKVVRVTADIK